MRSCDIIECRSNMHKITPKAPGVCAAGVGREASTCRLEWALMADVRTSRFSPPPTLHLGPIQPLQAVQAAGTFWQHPLCGSTRRPATTGRRECQVPRLSGISGSIGALTGLRQLDVSCCPSLAPSDALATLNGLQQLDAWSCTSLQQLFGGMGALASLRQLEASIMSSSQQLPVSGGAPSARPETFLLLDVWACAAGGDWEPPGPLWGSCALELPGSQVRRVFEAKSSE